MTDRPELPPLVVWSPQHPCAECGQPADTWRSYCTPRCKQRAKDRRRYPARKAARQAAAAARRKGDIR